MPTILFRVIEQFRVQALLDLFQSTIDLFAVVLHCNVIELVQQLRLENDSFGEEFPPVWKRDDGKSDGARWAAEQVSHTAAAIAATGAVH